jgi:hypothetical protein
MKNKLNYYLAYIKYYMSLDHIAYVRYYASLVKYNLILFKIHIIKNHISYLLSLSLLLGVYGVILTTNLLYDFHQIYDLGEEQIFVSDINLYEIDEQVDTLNNYLNIGYNKIRKQDVPNINPFICRKVLYGCSETLHYTLALTVLGRTLVFVYFYI